MERPHYTKGMRLEVDGGAASFAPDRLTRDARPPTLDGKAQELTALRKRLVAAQEQLAALRGMLSTR